MNLPRLVIPLISAAVLSGLILLGYLIIGFDSSERAPGNTLLHHFQAAPVAWSYALASSVLSLGFLLWLPWQLPAWRLRPAFRELDAAAVDNDPVLSRRFYTEALAFRLQYGEKRFVRQIIDRFDFFFDFHNSALHWLNEIVKLCEPTKVPEALILTSICAGQIGRFYNGVCYGSGLANPMIAENEYVCLHARMDSVEIWTTTSSAPVAILQRQPLTLEHLQTYPGFVSAYLIGVEKITGSPLHLELRSLETDDEREYSAAAPANAQMQAFYAWVANLSGNVQELEQRNFGIDVAEIHEHAEEFIPPPAATPLTQHLQHLLGSHIDGFFARASLSLAVPNIDLDAVVLCSGVGIVTIRDIPLAGTFSYSGDPDWTHIDADSSRRFDNACVKAQQTKSAFAKLLSTRDLSKWPVHSLVVCSHPDVTLQLDVSKQREQCDVIKLAQLPNWFASETSDDTIRFTKDDYNRFIALLDPTRGQVETAMRA